MPLEGEAMSETPEEVETPEAPEVEEKETPKEEPFDQERALAKIRKANAEAESLRRRLKEMEPLAQKAKELEDANKTETQRLTERLEKAEKEATDALKLRVALKKGLTLTQAKRLVGSTEEELEADADELLADFAPKQTQDTPKVPSKPKERLRGGGEPDEEPEETDPRKLAALVSRNR